MKKHKTKIMTHNVCIVICTAASEDEARNMGKALVEERLAACASIIAPVRSLFFWRGDFCEEREAMLLIKTEKSLIERVISRVREIHSYELPEIIVIPVVGGDQSYLNWVSEAVMEQSAAERGERG